MTRTPPAFDPDDEQEFTPEKPFGKQLHAAVSLLLQISEEKREARAAMDEGRSLAAEERMARNIDTASRIASAFAAILGEPPKQLPALLKAYWPEGERAPGRIKEVASSIRYEPIPEERARALRLVAQRYFPGASRAPHFVKGVPGAGHTMPLPERVAALRAAIHGR